MKMMSTVLSALVIVSAGMLALLLVFGFCAVFGRFNNESRARKIEVGKVYRLSNGALAKVIRYAPDESPTFPYLVSADEYRHDRLKPSMWWINKTGEPNAHGLPKIVVTRHDAMVNLFSRLDSE
jgi:hypothetical protein